MVFILKSIEILTESPPSYKMTELHLMISFG
jgi:hypothetical protein